MSDSDVHFIYQMEVIVQERIQNLMRDFSDEFIDNTDHVIDLKTISIHELMIELPEKYWNTKMHQIYGQLISYGHVYQFIEARINGSKPLLLGDTIYLDE